MMKHSMLVGYDPHCSVFARERETGIYYQIQYRLPGGQRRQISLGKDKKIAYEKKFIIESHLREFQFDEADLKRMPEEIRVLFNRQISRLDEALERYLVATEADRKPNTNRNIRYPLQKVIGILGVTYIHEVTGEHAQKVNSVLKSQNLADATRHSYLSLAESFFNWLINVAGL